jgi:hypothetical protein
MHIQNYTAGSNALRMISIHEQKEHRHMERRNNLPMRAGIAALEKHSLAITARLGCGRMPRYEDRLTFG